MIYEYALDPDLLDNWETIRYFKDNCGMEKGRLISDYPRDWIRLVFEVIRTSGLGQMEKAKLKEAIRHIKRHKLFRRTTCNWDAELNWIDNAIAEHRARPFRAIVGKCDNDKPNGVLSGQEIDETTDLWNCDCGSIVRNAVSMAKAVTPLLDLSQNIKFIDPYFNAEKDKFSNPLIAMLKIIADRDNGIPIHSVEYHISDRPNNGTDEAFNEIKFKTDVDTYLKPRIPKNISLSFIQWYASRVHNRYIITDVGCVRFGIGLDEYTGTSPDRDEVERLSDVTYSELWKTYSSGTPFYTVTGEYDDEI